MTELEVPQPIICSPFDDPVKHWRLEEGTAPTEPTPGGVPPTTSTEKPATTPKRARRQAR